MKKWVCFLALLTVAQMAGAQGLYENFANPPQEARPRVWWHWMDGNVSIDGITKDIDWMERAGIGGFHQFDAGGLGMRPIVDETMPYQSPQWQVAVHGRSLGEACRCNEKTYLADKGSDWGNGPAHPFAGAF